MTYREHMREQAKRYLKQLMRTHGGSVQEASKAAGVHRQSLYEMLHRYDLLPRRPHGQEGNAEYRALQ